MVVSFFIATGALEMLTEVGLLGSSGYTDRISVYTHVTSIEWTTVTAYTPITPIPTPAGTVTSIDFSTVYHTATSGVPAVKHVEEKPGQEL